MSPARGLAVAAVGIGAGRGLQVAVAGWDVASVITLVSCVGLLVCAIRLDRAVRDQRQPPCRPGAILDGPPPEAIEIDPASIAPPPTSRGRGADPDPTPPPEPG